MTNTLTNKNRTSHEHDKSIRPAASPDDGLEIAISRGHDDEERIVLEVLKVSANTISFELSSCSVI
jgi:hypothetical protein